MIAYPAAVAGILTRVLEAGEGAATVLFLHGAGARADRWRRNLDAAAGLGFRCLALDFPGHGFAQKGAGFAYGVPGYADLVERFLADRSIERAHIVGTSLGAHVAATLACRRPERVRSLALVGATGLFPVGQAAAQAIAERIKDRSRAGIERKLRGVMFDPVHVTPELVAEEHAINNSPGTDEAFEALSAYFRDRIEGDVVGEQLAQHRSKFPMTLIWGEEDRSVPLAVGRRAAELLREAPLQIIPRTAHAPYYEDAERFNALLRDFLGSAQ